MNNHFSLIILVVLASYVIVFLFTVWNAFFSIHTSPQHSAVCIISNIYIKCLFIIVNYILHICFSLYFALLLLLFYVSFIIFINLIGKCLFYKHSLSATKFSYLYVQNNNNKTELVSSIFFPRLSLPVSCIHSHSLQFHLNSLSHNSALSRTETEDFWRRGRNLE